jgi:hypothetical protein
VDRSRDAEKQRKQARRSMAWEAAERAGSRIKLQSNPYFVAYMDYFDTQITILQFYNITILDYIRNR